MSNNGAVVFIFIMLFALVAWGYSIWMSRNANDNEYATLGTIVLVVIALLASVVATSS